MTDPARIRKLAERLLEKRAVRATLSAEATWIAAQALRVYADILEQPKPQDDLNRPFVVQVVDEDGHVEEVLAKCGHAIVARVAFVEACRHRPGKKLELRHGARVLERHEKGET